ncbi:hypothetical protein RchiOBHm_Chr2g0126561 [Rosa chinensis]|uniref:Uncharacterized protein n=1 Tax=Rosa chinensis TaxID=74649 RepID=A0A2P6RTU8_ROSCH|nr:hypothetical protein RchiOBHm_Chr2g0126561 [Rosa chinensis]
MITSKSISIAINQPSFQNLKSISKSKSKLTVDTSNSNGQLELHIEPIHKKL